jgi:hypothetical protein
VAQNLLDESVDRAKLVVRFGNTFIGYGGNAIDWYDGYALVPEGNELRPGQRRGSRYLLDAFEEHGLPLVLNDLRMDVISGSR